MVREAEGIEAHDQWPRRRWVEEDFESQRVARVENRRDLPDKRFVAGAEPPALRAERDRGVASDSQGECEQGGHDKELTPRAGADAPLSVVRDRVQ